MTNPIQAYREAKGLTQEQLADMAGVQKAAVSKWEKGVLPSFESAKKLHDATDGALPRWELRPDIWDRPLAEAAE